MTGPPMYLNLDFIATSLVGMVAGLASAVVLAGFTWWAPLVLVAAWGSTHWLLRESGVWKDRNTPEVRSAQRHADYAYRLAVDPQPAKELRLFGLAGWAVDRFIARRKQLFELQYRATRLRERSVAVALVAVAVAQRRGVRHARRGGHGRRTGAGPACGLRPGRARGEPDRLRRAQLGARRRCRPGGRGGPAAARPWPRSARSARAHEPAGRAPEREIALRDLSFRYPGTDRPVFSGLDLVVPAGTSLAIVGQNGAGKTTLAKLLCRLYDPDEGAIEVDGIDLRRIDLAEWRNGVTAVFQDFVRFELSLRENVDPGGQADDAAVRAALADAGADQLAELDTPLAKGYTNGTDLSGGQWQRVALARALCAVRRGARLVLLDEPTAQLDVRGEAAVFDRVLTATRDATTILISHRFSTVRHADRICVLEHGHVVELGSHDELMARGGRYQTMFELQARRFEATMDEEGAVFDVL